ncbi:glycosyltransferase family 2 protein [Halomonas sp. DP1Y21-3]|uniref:glycosyltransferase family A protein n=1 Tax=Halomonas sp. DP1Y21-3 TaxID=2859080 RepID=UPI001C941C8E|nr:glycosyltransferase family A protein [Halomonas sp. DP1Y21-3]MBY6112365.1 glycosyltransferase family 2 protein [Halomonas sp. DP1Y21-3]
MLTVIVPIYNNKRTVERCLLSILSSNQVVSVVVVDDGSSDGGLDFISDKFRKNIVLGKVKLLKKINGGVSSARNIGLKYVSTDYFTFVDADDWVDSDVLDDLMVNRVYPSGKDVIATPVKGKKCKEIKGDKLISYSLKCMAIGDWPFSVCSSIFNSRLLTSQVYFDERYKHGEDIGFLLMAMTRGSIESIDKAYYYYDTTESTATSYSDGLEGLGYVSIISKKAFFANHGAETMFYSFLVIFKSFFMSVIINFKRRCPLKILYFFNSFFE